MKIKVDHLVLDFYQPDKERHSEPVLLIHGAGGTSQYWENYLNYFAGQGWKTYAVNLRGHFPSGGEKNLAQVTLEDYIEDVELVTRRLHIEDSVLIGHSLGGLIAQKVTERNTSFSGLVTLCSAPPMGIVLEVQNDVPYAEAFIKTMWGLINMKPVKPTFALAEKTVLNNIEPERREEVFEMFVAESLVVGYQVAQGFPVMSQRIRCPKLVIGCAQDSVAPPYMQKKLAEFLGADYAGYEQYAHLPMIEKGWEQLAGDIAKWLQTNIKIGN